MIALLLLACGPEPVRPDPVLIQTADPDYTVRRLFEADGCVVYRFVDADKYRYFTRRAGASTETLQGTNDCHTVTTTTGTKPPITTTRAVCEDGGSIPTLDDGREVTE